MHHKQQLSSLQSHGSKSVGQDATHNPAGTNLRDPQDLCGSQEELAAKTTSEISQHQRLARGRATVLQPGISPQHVRCEVLGSFGVDSSGVGAIPCGARADVVCEFCGPLCLRCAEETFCFYSQHRLTNIEAWDGDRADIVQPKPLFKVVYFQLNCANCGDVRLALPQTARPITGSEMFCPECAGRSLWRYLAHGLTQRELPFYEKFSVTEEERQEEQAIKRRVPWDRRGRYWEE